MPMSASAAANAAIEALASRHAEFSASPAAERVELARAVLKRLQADEWSTGTDCWIAQATALEKLPGTDDGEVVQYGSTARFIFGSVVQSFCTTFIAANEADGATAKAKASPFDKPSRQVGKFTVSAQVAVGMSAPGMSFELFSDESYGPADDAVAAYTETGKAGTASVVLGAGNQNFLSLVDALERCLVHSECVLLKHHPLRPFLLAPYACVLSPLIEAGVLAQVLDEGVPETVAMVAHPLVSHVHVTGSEATYNALLSEVTRGGKSPEQCGVTAELGCATPWLVMPGAWSEQEITNGAKLIATAKKANGGCNCLSAQTVVLPSAWPQKAAFMEQLEHALATQRTFPSYYPGSVARAEQMAKVYGGKARRIESTNRMPTATADDDTRIVECGLVRAAGFEADAPVLVADDAGVASADGGDGGGGVNSHALCTEAFGPLLAVVEVEMGEDESTDSYMARCCSWANSDDVCGSLSCSLLAPASASSTAVDNAAAALDFGTVAVNTWSVFGYTCATLGGTWGAHPADKRSGRGRIGNLFNVPNVVKTVVRASPLQKLEVDLSVPPPALLMDLLHALIIKSDGVLGVCMNLAKFAFFRTVNLLWTPNGRRYGSVF